MSSYIWRWEVRSQEGGGRRLDCLKGDGEVCVCGGGWGEILGSPFPLCSYAEQYFGPGTRLTVLGKKPRGREDGLSLGRPPERWPSGSGLWTLQGAQVWEGGVCAWVPRAVRTPDSCTLGKVPSSPCWVRRTVGGPERSVGAGWREGAATQLRWAVLRGRAAPGDSGC